MANLKIKFKSHAPALKKWLEGVLEARLDKAAEHMQSQLVAEVSNASPSKPGQPPGKASGGLAGSIRIQKRGKGVRAIGTPQKLGFWLEVGTHGPVLIRPRGRRALKIPVSKAVAEREMQQDGGVIQEQGQYFLLRQWVLRGPMRARPWVRRTFLRNMHRVGRTLSQRIH